MSVNHFTFLGDVVNIRQQYSKTGNIAELTANLSALSKKYAPFVGVGDYLLTVGNSYIASGDYPAGILFITAVATHFPKVANTTLLCLRMAEYYIENGDTVRGTAYLISLCEKTSNYEESIEFNELTDVWLKYKHLVEGKVPESVRIQSTSSPSASPSASLSSPLPPEKCSKQIGDIFALAQSDILGELSAHLAELSANGSSINSLNKWERLAFYADELCMEVNSGGFEGYLYYHGHHFAKAYQALETMNSDAMLAILDRVQEKFPRKKVPNSLSRIQDKMDAMEEAGIDFEAEDSDFYSLGEKALLKDLLRFVVANKEHFR